MFQEVMIYAGFGCNDITPCAKLTVIQVMQLGQISRFYHSIGDIVLEFWWENLARRVLV